MTDNNKLDERNVTDKPITETYKGILRVGNNIDIIEDIPDDFLHSAYFSDEWSGDGFNITRSFLDEESPNKRYSIKDAYSNLKLPVTDSMGNFLNFALGQNSSEIGKMPSAGKILDCTKQFNDEDKKTFTVVNSNNYIVMGLSPRVLEASKKVEGASLYIDGYNGDSARLVINNAYLHGKSEDSNKLDTIASAGLEQVRTIYSYDGNPKKYDAFIYNQENYKISEDKKSIDCYISIDNIKDYVSNRLAGYLKNNTNILPSGTIVSQYCDLSKWFCISTDSKVPDDLNCWQGYRPAMYTSSDTPFAYWNNLQGKACHAQTYLYFNGDNSDYLTNELPPDFKRGYVLCNGDGFIIQLIPSYIQGESAAKKSLDLFFNLFYTIGYYYHNDIKDGKLIKPGIRQAIKSTVNGKTHYEFAENIVRAAQKYYPENTNITLNTCYGIDMAIILAFITLNKQFSSSNNTLTSVDKVLNWLKEQPIPDEYVFNVIPDDDKAATNYYSYSDNSGNTININIGREISKFSDKIPYFYYENKEWVKTESEIYNMAEIRHMAKLFVEKSDNGAWDDYNFTFYVPKLFTTTDESVNLGESYRLYGKKITDLPQVAVGLFVGSNGLPLADSVSIAYNNKTLTDLKQSSHTFNTTFNMSPGLIPHSHAIAKGDLIFNGTYEGGWYKPANIDSSGSKMENLIKPTFDTDKRTFSSSFTPDITHHVASNYHTTLYAYNEKNKDGESNVGLITNSEMKNYILQEATTSATLENNYNYCNGMHGREYKNLTYDTSTATYKEYYKWHGASSEAIWYDDIQKLNSVTKKYTEGNSEQGYFRPESIKVLPLIKL